MLLVKRTLKVIAICVAVSALLLLRRPPSGGNAAVTRVEEELLHRVPAEWGPENELPPEWLFIPKQELPKAEDASAVGDIVKNQPAEEIRPRQSSETLEVADMTEGSGEVQSQRHSRHTSGGQVGAEVREITAMIGVVDARNCVGLNYNQVMQGAVSTRMVWNGHTFVPQKVCVVKEGDSVASVWSFEQSGSAVLSELRAGSKAHRGPANK